MCSNLYFEEHLSPTEKEPEALEDTQEEVVRVATAGESSDEPGTGSGIATARESSDEPGTGNGINAGPDLSQQVKDLQGQLLRLVAEKDALQQKMGVGDMTLEAEELKGQLKVLQAEKDALQEQHKEEVTELEWEVTQLLNVEKTLTATIESANADLMVTQEKQIKLKSESLQLNTTISELRQQVATLCRQLEASQIDADLAKQKATSAGAGVHDSVESSMVSDS